MYRVLFMEAVRNDGKVLRKDVRNVVFDTEAEAVNFVNRMRLVNGNFELISIREVKA